MLRIDRRSLLRSVGGSIALAGLAAASPARAQQADPQLTVDEARIVAERFRNDADFANMKVYVQNAYGVLIFPQLLKAGFVVGAEYGTGVMLTRAIRTGEWSAPAFMMLIGGSVGLQIGGKVSDVILTVMNDGAVQRIISSKFKLGADASIAAGPAGAGVGAGTTTQFGEDIYSFARGKGLYGGLSLDGSGIVPKDEWNHAYYGRPITAQEILRDRTVQMPAGAQALARELSAF